MLFPFNVTSDVVMVPVTVGDGPMSSPCPKVYRTTGATPPPAIGVYIILLGNVADTAAPASVPCACAL